MCVCKLFACAVYSRKLIDKLCKCGCDCDCEICILIVIYLMFFSWTWSGETSSWLWTHWNLVSWTIHIAQWTALFMTWIAIHQKLIEPALNLFLLQTILISNENAGGKLLKQLSKINRPLQIKFAEMLNLMDQCDVVEKQNHKRHRNPDTNKANDDNSFQFKNNPFSVFSGILPGNVLLFTFCL